MSNKKDFIKLNVEYQKCLNEFYDKFLEGKDVEIDNNLCSDILEKMKSMGDFYKNIYNEFMSHDKQEEKK